MLFVMLYASSFFPGYRTKYCIDQGSRGRADTRSGFSGGGDAYERLRNVDGHIDLWPSGHSNLKSAQ